MFRLTIYVFDTTNGLNRISAFRYKLVVIKYPNKGLEQKSKKQVSK